MDYDSLPSSVRDGDQIFAKDSVMAIHARIRSLIESEDLIGLVDYIRTNPSILSVPSVGFMMIGVQPHIFDLMLQAMKGCDAKIIEWLKEQDDDRWSGLIQRLFRNTDIPNRIEKLKSLIYHDFVDINLSHSLFGTPLENAFASIDSEIPDAFDLTRILVGCCAPLTDPTVIRRPAILRLINFLVPFRNEGFPLTEDEVRAVRMQVYFQRSLTSQLIWIVC